MMMMIKFILLSLCIYSVYSNWIDEFETQTSKCSENEEFRCDSTCFESCQGEAESCEPELSCGCACKPGFVRLTKSKTSSCVKKEFCSRQKRQVGQCGPNQVYSSCASSCPRTCADVINPNGRQSMACLSVCVARCTCKSGFYLNNRGKCVEPAGCCTGAHEVYRFFGPSCQATCQNPKPSCSWFGGSGCYCESPDYVRKDNSRNSPCIPRNRC